MKNVDEMSMSSSIHSSTIIVCKEETRKGKSGKNLVVKAGYSKRHLTDDIEICSLEDRRSVPTYQQLEELRELFKTSPTKYVEKLILTQFGNLPVLGESVGTSYLLPNRFQRFYENCVTFYGEQYRVYFNDLAIEHFARFIKELREKRKQDCLKYAHQMITSGKAHHLKLSISKGFDFNKTTECVFCKNEDQYVRYLDPKNVLYYCIDQDKEGSLDKIDIENMIKVLTMFSEKQSGLSYMEWNKEEAVAFTHNGGSIKLTGRDLNEDDTVFEKMYSLIRKK